MNSNFKSLLEIEIKLIIILTEVHFKWFLYYKMFLYQLTQNFWKFRHQFNTPSKSYCEQIKNVNSHMNKTLSYLKYSSY